MHFTHSTKMKKDLPKYDPKCQHCCTRVMLTVTYSAYFGLIIYVIMTNNSPSTTAVIGFRIQPTIISSPIFSVIHPFLLPYIHKKINHFRERDRRGKGLVAPKQTIVSSIPTQFGFPKLLRLVLRPFISYPLLPSLVPQKETMIYEFTGDVSSAMIRGLVRYTY